MTRTCQHPGCPATFPASQGRGRPALYCREHRSTRYAMVRKRHFPDVIRAHVRSLPSCCQDAGRICPQHRWAARNREHMRWHVSAEERGIVRDLLDVFGVATIWSSWGKELVTFQRREFNP